MAKRKYKKSKVKKYERRVIILALVLLVVLAIAAICLYKFRPDTFYRIFPFLKETDKYEIAEVEKIPSSLAADGEFSVHFPELGNKYAGDCIYIKAGDNDILIDAGSKTSCVPTISEYLDRYVTDGILEYVIVTHAHEDHYAGFATPESVDSIFDLYVCETIITFSMTNQKETGKMYSDFTRELNDEIAAGATHLTASQCIRGSKNVFTLDDGITMEILDSKYYYEKTDSENDYSVCVLFTQGERNFLFTGDLESKGEKALVEMNELPEVSFYKAGHHGSKTSSSEELLSVIRPDIVFVSCVAGSSEYTKTAANQFPTQDFIDRISKYTDRVYITTLMTDNENGKFTSFNGTMILSSHTGEFVLSFTKDNTRLKDSEWFRENRTCPSYWK